MSCTRRELEIINMIYCHVVSLEDVAGLLPDRRAERGARAHAIPPPPRAPRPFNRRGSARPSPPADGQPKAHRFADMAAFNARAALKIGDGAGHAQHPVIAAR
jgi:Activator of osmoprotectant transporter ProP